MASVQFSIAFDMYAALPVFSGGPTLLDASHAYLTSGSEREDLYGSFTQGADGLIAGTITLRETYRDGVLTSRASGLALDAADYLSRRSTVDASGLQAYLYGGADTLTGSSGNDALRGFAGADQLSGGEGHDVLDGGPGNDTLQGGAGSDIYLVDSAADVLVESNVAGTDLVLASASYTLPAFVEVLMLAAGISGLDGAGNDQVNTVLGNAQANVLLGHGGLDLLHGGAGNDSLNGGASSDILSGDAGADTLTGGAGGDVFLYSQTSDSPAQAGDTITDFSPSQGDYLDFSALDADATRAGRQFFSWIGAAEFSGVAGQLRYGATGVLQADTNGDSGPDFQLTLQGVPSLSSVASALFYGVSGVVMQAFQAIDMAHPVQWSSRVVLEENDYLALASTSPGLDYFQINQGSFSYGSQGDVLSADITRLELSFNGLPQLMATGITGLDWALYTALLAADDPQAMQAHVLRGNDLLFGTSVTDVLTGYAGNDRIYAGGGSDTVVYGGLRADYLITPISGGHTVQDLNPGDGDDGTDTLYQVENLRFADRTIDLIAPVAPKLVTGTTFDFLVQPQVTLQTSLGNIVVALDPERAPVTVANMLAYVNSDFYDGTLFHRVIKNFMVQGGGLLPGMTVKTPSYAPIALESANGLANLRGTIAMARTSAADSATSQFFINHVDNAFLNFASSSSPGYAVFGSVISGMSVVDAMANVATTSASGYQDVPVNNVLINTASQTLSGEAVARAAVLRVTDLEANASWDYSVDGGRTWQPGSGSSFIVPVGSYAAGDIQVRQIDASGNLSVGAGMLTHVLRVDNSPLSGQLTVTGAPQIGQTLTLTDTLADADGIPASGAGALHYQWFTGNTPIIGATGASLLVTEALAGNSISVRAGYTDLAGTTEQALSNVLQIPLDRSLLVQSYSWKQHIRLTDVSLAVGPGVPLSSSTDGAGESRFALVSDNILPLVANRPISPNTQEASQASAAVNLQDAIAILKMIVGLPVNGAGQPLSPYQAYAADFDGSGEVTLTDAIGVLKHVVGLSAPQPQWVFFNETDPTVPGKGTAATQADSLSLPGLVADLSGQPVSAHVGLVGVLRGDVDGGYAGGGTQALATTYFSELVNSHSSLGLNLAQFGVY